MAKNTVVPPLKKSRNPEKPRNPGGFTKNPLSQNPPENNFSGGFGNFSPLRTPPKNVRGPREKMTCGPPGPPYGGGFSQPPP